MRRLATRLAALAAALLLAASNHAAAAEADPGWSRLDLPAGGHAWLYVPQTAERPLPVVLFLHGAGGSPEPYRPWVGRAAERAGVAAVLPRSATSQGWGLPGDDDRVEDSLAAAAAAVPLDLRRVGIGGHSAGAAYAYLLVYSGSFRAGAVFTMAAPYYPVGRVSGDPPPIRMYYGKSDPNYATAYPRLADQWELLGVPWEADLRGGYGHNGWPQESVDDGFAFLAAADPIAAGGDCRPGPTVLCLHDGRYSVSVAWEDHEGNRGAGRVVPAGSVAAGLFWFFAEDNWELMVKVLDGCGVNGHRWVFSAATTDVAYELTVHDTGTGRTWRHANDSGVPAPAVTDTAALPCP